MSAEATIKSQILDGIAATGLTYVPAHIDCARLVDEIYRALISPATLWALREIASHTPNPTTKTSIHRAREET